LIRDTPADDFGGVHINSGIPNKAFYVAAVAIGGYAWERVGQIWFASLARLRPNSNFADFAKATDDMAAALFGKDGREHRAVRDAWRSVGIDSTAVASPSKS
jgi:Zn-dependent metalloprotease